LNLHRIYPSWHEDHAFCKLLDSILSKKSLLFARVVLKVKACVVQLYDNSWFLVQPPAAIADWELKLPGFRRQFALHGNRILNFRRH